MNHINDALKRAQREQRKIPPPPGPKLPGLLPAASAPGDAIGWILPGAIGFLIVAACLFIGMALITRTVTNAAGKSGPPRPLAASPANPAVPSSPATLSTARPLSLPPAASRPSPPPPPQELKLQGIVYAATGAWAIVDGQTVLVGDRLGDFRVKEISPRGITLEKGDGSLKKLSLDK